jgi:hypothetical protein
LGGRSARCRGFLGGPLRIGSDSLLGSLIFLGLAFFARLGHGTRKQIGRLLWKTGRGQHVAMPPQIRHTSIEKRQLPAHALVRFKELVQQRVVFGRIRRHV